MSVDDEQPTEFQATLRSIIRPSWVNPISGATAGFVVASSLAPLDVIKAMLQVQGASRFEHQIPQPKRPPSHSVVEEILHPTRRHKYRGTFGSMGTILREEGLRGLYRGLAPQLIGFVPNWAVYFTIYSDAKEFLEKKIPEGEGLGWVTPSTSVRQASIEMLSASIGGALSSVMMNPIWVVRTRLQTQTLAQLASKKPERPYRSTFHCFQTIWQNEGYRGFFKGLVPSLIGTIHVIIQFPLVSGVVTTLCFFFGREQNR